LTCDKKFNPRYEGKLQKTTGDNEIKKSMGKYYAK
jgi:hypothetical protein